MTSLVRCGLKLAVVAVVGVMAVGAGSVQAGTVYVSTAGNDASNGLSWGTAKLTVQAGLNTAASGDQVWVKAGTYVQRITLKAGVGLYGGFAGTETDLAQRDWVANVTVLDGSLAGSVVTAPTGAAADTRIDGFTIRNGSGTGSDPTYYYAAGINCTSSSPTIANNTITGNYPADGIGGPSCGGGIYCSSSSPAILNNLIAENGAQQGGGIYCRNSSAPMITNNRISGNWGNKGGGICADYDSSPTIANNTITGNEAEDEGSGAGIYCWRSSPTIANNTITGNSTSGTFNAQGGGVYCSESPAIITGNTITRNAATSSANFSSYGGGIYCTNSSPTILDNVIRGNIATSGGGINLDFSPTGMVANNTITANGAASWGGGLRCDASSPTVVNNTIMGNGANKGGGGVYCYGSSSTIANTIIAFNSSGILATGTQALSLQHNCVYGNRLFDYSGLADPTGVDGNISAEPKLASTAYGDVHIQPDSPCVDAGEDGLVQAGWTDMDGQGRKQGAHVDIGADESDGTVYPSGPFTIVRVAAGGDDGNDGSSWGLAKRTVQAGIDAAASVGGDVWVQAGTYQERITLRSFVHVYGGFAGTETQRSGRDFSNHVTTLDGNQGGSVVTAAEACSGPSTIDGFTIRNGSGTKSLNLYGGGIYCSGAWPTIANNLITANSVAEAYGGGGGIYCCSGSTATITDNTIANNGAANGGGISSYVSSPTVARNTITGNSGYGIYCSSSPAPLIASNTIASNPSTAIYCYYSAPTIVNNAITGNGGTGIYCDSSSPMIANDTIAGHTSYAIYCSSSSPTIVNTIVAYNSSGIYKTGTGTASLRFNCVYGNRSYNYTGLSDPTGTFGNISMDPRLAQAYYANVHIQPDSPCVDAGDDSVVQAGWVDIDGQARVQGAHVDIGVDESDGTVWPTVSSFVVRVSPGGNDANDGSSWRAAKRSLQSGVSAASAYRGGQVWVAGGTYAERISLSMEIGIYGGFAAGETELSQRNWTANRTILDGSGAGRVVMFLGTVGAAARIDGFTIRNGKSTRGGGVWCNWSSPTIMNNTITGNIATNSGAGIDCSSSTATIANNVIAGNVATASGGGIYCEGNGSPTIVNNTITGNMASAGGGVYCTSSSPATLANTIIAFNSSGLCAGGASLPDFQCNCVYGNTAYNYSAVDNPTWTNGNILADPLFVRPVSPGPDGVWGTADDDYGDLRLLPGSPCIDAGNNADVPADSADLNGNGNTTEPLPFDLAGGPRFLDDPQVADTGAGTAPIVDMGAYERSRPVADVDGDWEANVVDLLWFVGAFGTNSGDAAYDARCDFNHDGAVDMVDLLTLVAEFGK